MPTEVLREGWGLRDVEPNDPAIAHGRRGANTGIRRGVFGTRVNRDCGRSRKGAEG